MVLPVAEAGDETLANLAGGIFSAAKSSFHAPGYVSHHACRAGCESHEWHRSPPDNKYGRLRTRLRAMIAGFAVGVCSNDSELLPADAPATNQWCAGRHPGNARQSLEDPGQ